jgi:transcriptional regulator of acetoin/glycerol metabolism
MERAVILSENPSIGPEDLRLYEGQGMSLDQSLKLEDVEQRTILTVLDKCRGNHSRAAEMLDISRTTLYAKLKKYGL